MFKLMLIFFLNIFFNITEKRKIFFFYFNVNNPLTETFKTSS